MNPVDHGLELSQPESPTADEAAILADQDETLLVDLSDNDPNIGSDGTPETLGAGDADFDRGEIDVKEAMDRTTATMDHLNHRARDPGITPHSKAGQVDSAEVLQDSLSNRRDEKALPLENTGKGHETNGYTDIGAGRSGVTRTKHIGP